MWRHPKWRYTECSPSIGCPLGVVYCWVFHITQRKFVVAPEILPFQFLRDSMRYLYPVEYNVHVIYYIWDMINGYQWTNGHNHQKCYHKLSYIIDIDLMWIFTPQITLIVILCHPL